MNASRCLRLLSSPSSSATTPSMLLRPSLARMTPIRQSQTPSSSRALSILTPRRPILQPTSTLAPSTQPSATSSVLPSPETLDILPKISSHPGLASLQIRCGPRDTYNPSHLVRKRRHGWLARIKTKNGRKMLMRRILKGRWNLSHAGTYKKGYVQG
ncbi:hypothetical protein EJ04DRAFT_455763 [Polyplosphaeria fusca]|uniref:Large ribosomal subunit protein bL34m n=1 Tax=Polyplosphaeria fusca TaxID=682080 RepID=A0A9P4V8F4_9PLEO|nr:hypothetical protein EJ04DRAFT_455763 [Polyplosphaeria fusca]